MPGRLRLLLVPLLALVLLGGPDRAAPAQVATPTAEPELGVVYVDTDESRLLLDIYRPSARDLPRPAVILIPGWGVGRIGMVSQAKHLAEAGYVAVVIDYRMEWPEHIDDAQLAVRWVRANADRYGVDPERICSYGHSTGGQLAAMLAVRETRDDTDPALAGYSSRVACAVDLAGENDLTIPYPDEVNNEWLVSALGGTLAEAPELYRDVSPVAFVDEHSTPFLVVHGAEDSTVSIESSRRLAAALQAAGAEVIYAELSNATHQSVDDWDVNGGLTLAFFARHLHPER